uniref:Integrase, catalytic region, zinc finger, CCHC-type, peptidase aspartic, catalytic n=1 Tax=Tanacetum cinerariifolium TaxID=118510 RepID=A0A6L2M5Q1_TANCI|nr:integrase, catalytic region, zinc finger, CCHC-type, peptidase aspartic, catalytic [Tanacetum cinerariifolium]
MKNLRIALQDWSENIQRKKEEKEKQIAEEQVAKSRYWKIPICYDDDEDYTISITPSEPDNSLSVRDEHLDTILAMKSDEFIKSSVENLVQTQKIYSNTLFDEEIIIDLHHFNADYDLIESMLNLDSSIISSSSKIDSFLDEFVEEFNSENSDAIIESFSPSPILVEDSDPFIEEIDLFLASDGSIPPGIDNDYSDSEGDNLFLERLFHDDPIPLPDTLDFSNICGNILIQGTCLKCNSRAGISFTYDPIPEYFNEVQIIPNPPPQSHFNIYWCRICESNSHYDYECSQRVPLVYEPEPCYTQNFSDNDYSHDLPGVTPLIDHYCCYKCGNSLNDFFCHQCTCEFCGNGAHVGYNCPAQVPSIQTLPSFPQQYPCCEGCEGLPEAYQCQPPQYTVNHPILNARNDLLDSQNKLIEQLTSMCDMLLICYDDDGDEERSISLKDNIISVLPSYVAITPISLTDEPDNSLSMGDEHLGTVLAMESDEFIKSSVENLDFFDSNDESTSIDDDSFSIDNIEYVEASPPHSELVSSEVMEIVIPKVGGIDDDILLTIKDDILREKLLNVNLLIANIEALKDNPTPSSDFMTKSSSTSLNSLLEETNTFDNSLPELKTFCFDLEEISSGSTTTRSDIYLLEYEAFYDDHVKEISSGSTTTHSDSSLYDSFIFDLSINPFPPADRSDFYEFADELTHIISSPDHCTDLPPNKKSILKNTNVLAPGMYKVHTESNQTRTSQLPQDSRKTNKHVSFSTGVILTTSVRRPQLKRNPMGDRVMRNNSQGKNHEVEDQQKFMGTVKFGNDQIAPILGYGDLVQRAIMIKMIYYVKGLNHNLFSVGQFCDVDLEVAFRKSTCFIRDLKGKDFLTGSRGTYLYSITLQDTNSPNPICLIARATSSQAWLWHHHLSHLNFDTINLLSKNDIVVGLVEKL